MTATSKTLERDKGRRAGSQPRAGAACDRDESHICPRISSAAANLKGMIDAGLIVHARLRELSTGDLVNLAVESMFLYRSLNSYQIVGALQELEDHRLVRRSETVSRFDSSEYLLTYSKGRRELLSSRGDLREPCWTAVS